MTSGATIPRDTIPKLFDGGAEALRENEDVKEFYLGVSGDSRRSFRDVKYYKRRKRWLV